VVERGSPKYPISADLMQTTAWFQAQDAFTRCGGSSKYRPANEFQQSGHADPRHSKVLRKQGREMVHWVSDPFFRVKKWGQTPNVPFSSGRSSKRDTRCCGRAWLVDESDTGAMRPGF